MLSSPSPAVLAVRPTAMSTCSTSSFSPSRSTTTPAPPGFTEATLTPVLRAIPRRVNARVSSFETSSSSTGTMRGSASTSVTWTPYAAKTSANSTPTAPAPMTAIDLGARSFRTAPFEEITVFSSMATPGSDFGSEPVARMRARASIVSAAVAPFTSTTFFAVSVPRPGNRVILFFRKRNSTPLAIRSATLRLRWTASA